VAVRRPIEEAIVADINNPAVTLWRRAVATGATSVLLLLTVYVLGVLTRPGQRFEDAVLSAADPASGAPRAPGATDVLAIITSPLPVAAILTVLIVAVLRQRVMLGIVATGVVVASVLTTEIVQRAVLRPILLDTGLRREDQSFPSGHTTVAASVMAALVLVTPARLRTVVVFVGTVCAAGVSVATVAAGWHRPSDTLGSNLIVVIYTCVALAVLARRHQVTSDAPEPGHRAGVLVLVAVAVAGGGLAVALGAGAPVTILTVGRALALTGSVALGLVLSALLRRIDLRPPRPAPAGDQEKTC
jgi:membrane-associated phospholipid phosphatase